jgi:low affinity Fe/Cu permease
VTKKIYNESKNDYVRLNSSMMELEKSLENKIDYIFKDKDAHMHKYIDYILQNNDKITEEKTEMLISLQEKNESFMKDSMDNVHQLLKDRDGLVETKNQFILEQKNKI